MLPPSNNDSSDSSSSEEERETVRKVSKKRKAQKEERDKKTKPKKSKKKELEKKQKLSPKCELNDNQNGEKTAINANGADVFPPCLTFEEANLPERFFTYCSEKFDKPTLIQSRCWPILLARRDAIAIAETGSGKTLAFVVPILVYIQKKIKQQNSNKPLALILAPTRELAVQTATVCDDIKSACDIKSLCLYGGVSKDVQRKDLKTIKPLIVIATPGRLLDFLHEGSCVLDSVSTLILDEADRMLDAGFEQDIKNIVSFLPKHPTRQTAVFTATWPPEVRALGNELLSNPLTANISRNSSSQSQNSEEFDDEFTLRANHSVKQIVEVIEETFAIKDRRLAELLKHYQAQYKSEKNDKPWRVLIFVLYKKDVSRVENYLVRSRWSVVPIHGDMAQNARFQSLEKFKKGLCPILIATDVAARGLDIPDVSVVINYSFPLTIADYIHRIGRTGRAGNTGVAHTLFTSFDRSHSGELVNVLREANQEVPEDLTKFGIAIKKKEHAFYGAHFKAPTALSGSAPQHIKF